MENQSIDGLSDECFPVVTVINSIFNSSITDLSMNCSNCNGVIIKENMVASGVITSENEQIISGCGTCHACHSVDSFTLEIHNNVIVEFQNIGHC